MPPSDFSKNLLLTKIFQMDFQTNNPHKRIFPPKSKVCKCILYCKMSNFGKRKSFFPRPLWLFFKICRIDSALVMVLLLKSCSMFVKQSYSLIILKNSIIRFPKCLTLRYETLFRNPGKSKIYLVAY